MSTVAKEKVKMYEMLLSTPGMEENCKVAFQISRRNILMLCQIIEVGLLPSKEDPEGVAALITKEGREELAQVVLQLLERGRLTGFYEKFKSL